MKNPVLEPLNDLIPFGEQAYQARQRAIVSGKFRPGSCCRSTGIASKFEISVTPVREAPNRLERAGLVVKAPY